VCPFSDGAVLTADGIEATISVVDDGYIHLDKTEGTAVRVSSDGSKSYMRSNAGEPSVWQSDNEKELVVNAPPSKVSITGVNSEGGGG
jgi:hypothetical protein